MTTEKDELRVDEMAMQAWREYGRVLHLRAPYLLVRVLPREQQISGSTIIVAGTKQNKPVEEGIVLKVFEPQVRSDGSVQCPLTKPGDHVLFPAFLGYPPPMLVPANRYRIIPETPMWHGAEAGRGGVHAVLEYDDEPLVKKVARWVQHEARIPIDANNATAEDIADAFAEQLLQAFYMVPMTAKARILSGV
ncbi:MAG: hypothetical protein KGL39_29075 [Patescibacteria group bacterium]|nr:hypothetical protein [Patescibacteria group bacterium]